MIFEVDCMHTSINNTRAATQIETWEAFSGCSIANLVPEHGQAGN